MLLYIYLWLAIYHGIHLLSTITVTSASFNTRLHYDYDEEIYPKSIPFYPIRTDIYSEQPVSRNRIDLIQGDILIKNNDSQKITPAEFRKIMQCKKNDFNIDNSGVINMIRAMKLTKKGLIRSFYYVHLNDPNANPKQADALYEKSLETANDCTQNLLQNFVGLFRLINNSLYFDHPVHAKCMISLERCGYAYQRVSPLQLLLNKVHGYKDSIFGFADELPKVNMVVPFPMFTSTAMDGFNDLVYPWWNMFTFELEVHKKAKAKNDLANFRSYAYTGQHTWENKHSKALLLSTMQNQQRSLYYHVAAMHPDLFVAAFVNIMYTSTRRTVGTTLVSDLRPISPNSDETTIECPPRECPNREPILNNYIARMKHAKHERNSTEKFTHVGSDNMCVMNTSNAYHNSELEKMCSVNRVDLNPTHFKYIVVPLGTYFKATANRIGALLGYSGAVILLADSGSRYHFSYHLRPWVHFVPFTHSGTDLAEKIQWLKDHDDMAQQIAENARRFADSHLRLEDYLCYWNHALERLGEAFEGSEAVRAVFDPQPVCLCPRSSENFFPGEPYC